VGDQELTAFHFRQEIYAMFREALSDDLGSIKVRAQDLHYRVAKKPSSAQEALLCCEVMRAVFNPQSGDLLIHDAIAGCEPELTIQYEIPRPEWGRWR
jgi:hypothetical protein